MTTTNPALALQVGVRDALLADAELLAALGGDRVYDHVPQDPTFPYITVGDIETRDWSTQTRRGHEHIMTLHVWSRYSGRKEVHDLIAEVERVLDGNGPALDDHSLVNLRVVFWTALRETDGETYHGVVRLRAVTEPIP